MEIEDEELMTPRDVAKLFGTCISTAKKLPINQYRLSERVIRFKRKEVLQYMAQKERKIYADSIMEGQAVG